MVSPSEDKPSALIAARQLLVYANILVSKTCAFPFLFTFFLFGSFWSSATGADKSASPKSP